MRMLFTEWVWTNESIILMKIGICFMLALDCIIITAVEIFSFFRSIHTLLKINNRRKKEPLKKLYEFWVLWSNVIYYHLMYFILHLFLLKFSTENFPFSNFSMLITTIFVCICVSYPSLLALSVCNALREKHLTTNSRIIANLALSFVHSRYLHLSLYFWIGSTRQTNTVRFMLLFDRYSLSLTKVSSRPYLL